MLDNAKFAALVCDWCLEAQPDQKIVIATDTVAEPFVAALQAALLEREAWPMPILSPAGESARQIAHGRDIHFDNPNPLMLALLDAADTMLQIRATTNTRELSGADPALLGRVAKAQVPIHDRVLARRWAITIWPTAALAQEANMSLAAYERFVASALFLDAPDPLRAWQDLAARQQEIVDRLGPAREVRIQSDRTDITLAVADRTWKNSDGKRNMPSGEVFTSPHESSANGQIYFDVPSSLGGVVVSGVALTFVDGVVTEAHADVGDDRLQVELSSDAGARRMGEIGIGTNYGIDRATGSTLLDEKIGGTVHLALGRSYPECGGHNESAIHWDIVCDLRQGGEITVDGETLSRNGQFI